LSKLLLSFHPVYVASRRCWRRGLWHCLLGWKQLRIRRRFAGLKAPKAPLKSFLHLRPPPSSASSLTQGLYHLQPTTQLHHRLCQLQLPYSESSVRAILHPTSFYPSSTFPVHPPNVRQIELGCLCIRATQTPSQPVRRRSCKYFAPCENLVVITQGPTADPQHPNNCYFML
jgi:hypothetical protein